MEGFDIGMKNKQQPSIFHLFILLLIVISVGLNNIVIGYKVAGVSVDRIIQILLFFILFKYFIRDLRDKNLKFIITIIGLFLILSVFNNYSLFLQGENNITTAVFIRDVIRVLMYAIFTYLVYYALKKDIKKINIILFIHFLAVLLVFFQYPFTPLTEWARTIKLLYFSNNMTVDNLNYYQNILENDFNILRVSGPYGQVVTLSYTFTVSGILTTFMYLKTHKNIYIYYLLFIFVVSLMTLTRSSSLAIVIMMVYLIPNKKISIPILIIFSIVYLNFDKMAMNEYRVMSIDDTSAQSRFPLLVTGVITLLQYPLGVTSFNYMHVKEWVYTTIFPNPIILKASSHNGIVNIGFAYTVIGIFLFFYFMAKLFQMSKVLDKKEKLFWLYAFFAYLVQESLHNNGIFYVEFNVLILLALYIANINMSSTKKER